MSWRTSHRALGNAVDDSARELYQAADVVVSSQAQCPFLLGAVLRDCTLAQPYYTGMDAP